MSVQMLRDVTDHHEKSSQRKRGNQQETQITYGEPPPGFEPRPLWLEASALTYAPTNLLPLVSSNEKRQVFTWCMGIVQARFYVPYSVSMVCVPIHHVPNVSSYFSFFLRVKPGNDCN